MSVETRWLLPEGIEELLPPQAERLERLRRRLLDHYHRCGYELVVPPMIEFLDSLLTGTGHDLDIQTFKLTDQVSGRMLGVRADMTPQVARMDAHSLKREYPTRLCYMGTVMRTRASGLAASRSPMQVGAELFGHAGVESDAEVLVLMLETLELAGIEDAVIDLGHVGIFRALAARAGLDDEQESALFDMLQRKARPEMRNFLEAQALSPAIAQAFDALVDLNGGEEVLTQARQALVAGGNEVLGALDYLAELRAQLRLRKPDVRINYDLAELRGYHYHTGVVFAAFAPGRGEEVGRGGRYDEIGRDFGRARPATGFSVDLKHLLSLTHGQEEPAMGVFAPTEAADEAFWVRVAQLRAEGQRVVCGFSGQAGDAGSMNCDRMLQKHAGDWKVIEIE